MHHVNQLGWKDFSDHQIFMRSRSESYDAIITFDDDFKKLILEFGFPPKIIHLKIGNASNANIVRCLENKKLRIYEFLNDSNLDYLDILTI